MTKGDIMALNFTLKGMGDQQGVKFSYAVAKNLEILRPEVIALQKSIEATPEVAQYEEKRIKLAKELSEKDEEGKEVIRKGEYIIATENLEEFDKRFVELKEEFKEAIEERQKQVDDYNEILKEELDIKLHKIKLEDVPETITTREMTGIYPIIEE